MKLFNKSLIGTCTVAAIAFLSCTGDAGLNPEGTEDAAQGNMELLIRGTAPTRSTTSVISPEEAKTFLVIVKRGGEIIRGPQTLGSMDMRFPVGQGYTVSSESCTEADAENSNNMWGQKRFTGESEPFGINKGQTTKVPVGMSVANAAFCVVIQPSLSNYFKNSCTVTVTEGKRTLVWNYDNAGKVEQTPEGSTTSKGQIAYFNIKPEGKRTISYKIEAVSDDKKVTKEGTIELSKAVNSSLNLAYDAGFFGLTVNVNTADLYVQEDLTVGPDDVIPDDGNTDAIGQNDDFNQDHTETDYDEYN